MCWGHQFGGHLQHSKTDREWVVMAVAGIHHKNMSVITAPSSIFCHASPSLGCIAKLFCSVYQIFTHSQVYVLEQKRPTLSELGCSQIRITSEHIEISISMEVQEYTELYPDDIMQAWEGIHTSSTLSCCTGRVSRTSPNTHIANISLISCVIPPNS